MSFSWFFVSPSITPPVKVQSPAHVPHRPSFCTRVKLCSAAPCLYFSTVSSSPPSPIPPATAFQYALTFRVVSPSGQYVLFVLSRIPSPRGIPPLQVFLTPLCLPIEQPFFSSFLLKSERSLSAPLHLLASLSPFVLMYLAPASSFYSLSPVYVIRIQYPDRSFVHSLQLAHLSTPLELLPLAAVSLLSAFSPCP